MLTVNCELQQSGSQQAEAVRSSGMAASGPRRLAGQKRRASQAELGLVAANAHKRTVQSLQVRPCCQWHGGYSTPACEPLEEQWQVAL